MRSKIEQWKPVVGCDGLYEVSDWGNVKSLGYKKTGKEGLLKPGDSNGYKYVQISYNGKRKGCLIHRLVWETFVGEIPAGFQINHLNEDRGDNRLDNLEVVTPKENCNYGSHNERIAKSIAKIAAVRNVERKTKRWELIGNLYDCSLTDKENLKVMKEHGLKVSLSTLRRWRRENNITKYKTCKTFCR